MTALVAVTMIATMTATMTEAKPGEKAIALFFR